MKKIYLSLIALLCAINFSYAQTNMFPTNGGVGIGTLSPGDLLQINAGTNRQGITITGDGNAAAYSDITMAINNTISIPAGTPISWEISHRKDGYFSDTPLGQSSLEFYANLKGGNYYAPLSFKSDGNVILASNKNAFGGNVGIGATSPAAKLSVTGTGAGYPATSGTTQSTGLVARLRDGTNLLLDIGEDGSNGFWFQSTDQINLASTYPILLNPNGGNVGIGTTSPDGKLTVNGTIHSKEVKIDLSIYPDYVFKPTYHLPSLAEVKSYIDKNHHLPDMPTEAEVVKNGLNLGETQSLLTKKVEELTLYLIEKDKEIKQLKQSQQHQINSLRKQISTLSKHK